VVSNVEFRFGAAYRALTSRSLELLSWFHCGLGFVLLVVVLWWQEQKQEGVHILGIYDNKAGIHSYVAPVASLSSGGRPQSSPSSFHGVS
jgi:hypothetical protein